MEFLCELFNTDKASLLQDMRETCQLTAADFAKMQLRFNRICQEIKGAKTASKAKAANVIHDDRNYFSSKLGADN